ncbi:tetratricopeptide repeat-containing sulfotransferase family protein [Altererythrobacter litoralis]|uniref:Sulfotransferase n=1 Tax=Altererythrobacter litoralis TaxID=3113904 RepID=A0ABU7GEX7_9SPHN|nr:sulfotransferase [Erythrobacteraceae bacterium 1XM1-14]
MNNYGTISTNPALARAQGLIDSEQYEQAAQLLVGYLRQNPNDHRALSKIGFCAMRLGALGQAEHFLRSAIARGARDFEARRNLAAVMSQQERPLEALPMFEQLAAESGDHSLKAIVAGLLEKTGRSDDARALYKELLEARADHPPLWLAYGHSLRSAGEVDQAIAAYRQAIAIDDEFGEAWWGIASIKRKVFDEADIAAMRQSLAIAIDPRNQAPLNFALARALHDRGEYEAAFRHYDEGNRIRAESLNYNAEELTQEVSEVERLVDAAYLSGLPKEALGESTPIFIVSLPRSGSTLLEQMLGSHPSIEPIGELPYIPAILRSFMEMATRRGEITVTEAIMQLPDQQAQAFGREYLRRAQWHRTTDRPFFIDKLPHNWSNILLIRRILPQARFIDIRRPAMDCCFSNFTQSFTSAHASSFALKDVGHSYVDNVRLMDHLQKVAPGMVHHVDYSALVADAQSELAPVMEYLGLPWDDALLQFHQLDRVVRTPSSEQVRRPLNRDGMEVWRPYSEWLDPLREVLGDLA